MENLLKNQKSLMISSLNENKEASISYAPFVMLEGDIYIYISKTAPHYNNLLNNKDCAVMVIEDEKDSKTIFARSRVSFNCEAKKLEENTEKVFGKFDEVHNSEMMSVLKNMDFDLFKLSIKNGRLVKGFGQAFDVLLKGNEFELVQVMGDGNGHGHGHGHAHK